MFAINRIALGVAAACWAFSASAQLTVAESMSGLIEVGGSPVAGANTPPDTSPIYDTVYTGSPFSSDSFFYGDLATGTTNVRVLAGDATRARSVLTYVADVTNNGPTAVDLSFSFFISGGRVSIDRYNPLSYEGDASLKGSITWGGTSLWGFDIDVVGSGGDSGNGFQENIDATYSTSGAASDFQISDGGDRASYSAYAKTLGLGLLGAGQTRRLEYTLDAEGFYSGTSDTDFYGYGGQAIVGAFDPFDFSGRPEDFTGGIATAPIPEPETYAMLGIGLGVVALARRRRRRGESPGAHPR